MQYCFLNGEYLPQQDASIKVSDRGFLLADGLFETLRCYQDQPFALEAHWQRLQRGAELMHIPMPTSLGQLTTTCQKLIELNKLIKGSSLRITLTRGSGPRGLSFPAFASPRLLIQNHPLSIKPNNIISLNCNYDYRITPSPLSNSKTLDYTTKIQAHEQAIHQGFGDAVLLNTSNEICCTSCANIFLVHDQELYTPQLNCGPVAGIMRQTIIDLATNANIPCHETSLRLNDLHQAKEVFITNSLIEIQQVTRFEHTPYPVDDHAVITMQLKQLLRHKLLD